MEWLNELSPGIAVIVECVVIMLFYFHAPKKPFMLYLVGILLAYTGVCFVFLREMPMKALDRVFPMLRLNETQLSESIFLLALMLGVPSVMCFCEDDGIPYSCSIAQCFAYVLIVILRLIGLLNNDTAFLLVAAVMGAPVVMIGCYVCMFFLAFSPGSGNTRSKAARIERTESSNSLKEGQAIGIPSSVMLRSI